MTDEDRLRRQKAKRFNERLKLAATLCNTIGVATFVTLVLAPVANDRSIQPDRIALALVFAAVLHCAGQLWLFLWRSED